MPSPFDDQDEQVDLETWERRVFEKQGVPEGLRRAIVGQESGGDINAKSATGVKGRYQVVQKTAQGFGLNRDDPWEQPVAAAKLLRQGYDQAKQKNPNFSDRQAWLASASSYYGGGGSYDSAGNLSTGSRDNLSNPARYAEGIAKRWSEFEKGGQPQARATSSVATPMPRQLRAPRPQRGPAVQPQAQPSPFSFTRPTGFQTAQQQVAQRTAQISPEVAAEADRLGRLQAERQARIEAKRQAYNQKGILGQTVEDVGEGLAQFGQFGQQAFENVLTGTGLRKGISALSPAAGAALRRGQEAQQYTAQQMAERAEAADSLRARATRGLTAGAGQAAAMIPIAMTTGGLGVAAATGLGQDWNDPAAAVLNTALAPLPLKAGQVVSGLAGRAASRAASPIAQALIRRGIETAAGAGTGAGQYAATQGILGRPIDPQEAITQSVVGGGLGGALAPPAVRRVGRGAPIEAAAPFRFRYDENGNPIPEPAPAPLALDEQGQAIARPDIAFPPLTRDVVGRPSGLGSGRPEEITDAPERMRERAYFGPGRARPIQARLAAREPRRVTRGLEPERQTLPIERTEPLTEPLQNLRSITSEQLRTQPLPPQPDAPPTQAMEQPAPPPSRIEQRRIERGQRVLGARDDAESARSRAADLQQQGDFDGARRARLEEIDALRAMRDDIKPNNRGGRIRRNEIGIQIEEAQASITKLKGQAREAAKARQAIERAPTTELPPSRPSTQQRLAEIERQTPSERLREYPGGELPRTVGPPLEGQPIEQVTRETGTKRVVPPEMSAPATQPPDTRPKTVGDYAESLRGEIPTGDLEAYQRLLQKYNAENPRPEGIRTRPGEPAPVSLSQYSDIVTNNRDAVNRLAEMNVDSAEAQPIIREIRQYARKNRFDKDHVDNLLNQIRNDQLQRAQGEDITAGEPNQPTAGLREGDVRLKPPTEPGQPSQYDRFSEPALRQKIDANNAVITRLQRRPNDPKAQARIEEIQRANQEIQSAIEGKQPSANVPTESAQPSKSTANVRTKGSAPLDIPAETGPTIQEIRAQERERIGKLSPEELESALTETEAKRNAAVRDPNSTDAQRQNLADQVRLYRGRRAELVKAKQLPPLNVKRPPRGERPRAVEAAVKSPLDQDVTQIPDDRLPKLIQDAERVLNNPELTPERKTKVEDFLRRARERREGQVEMPQIEESRFAGKSKEELQSMLEMYEDNIRTKEQARQIVPEVWRKGLTEVRTLLGGGDPQTEIVTDSQYYGHPEYGGTTGEDYGLIPIKIDANTDLNWRIEKAAQLREAAAKEVGKVKQKRGKRISANDADAGQRFEDLKQTEQYLYKLQEEQRSLQSKIEEPRTVQHPDEAINGKPILAETQDGRVIVPNEANKSGVSVVKDRSGEATTKKESWQMTQEEALADMREGVRISIDRDYEKLGRYNSKTGQRESSYWMAWQDKVEGEKAGKSKEQIINEGLDKQKEMMLQAHKNDVIAALNKGETIPDTVLAEYPDLQRKMRDRRAELKASPQVAAMKQENQPIFTKDRALPNGAKEFTAKMGDQEFTIRQLSKGGSWDVVDQNGKVIRQRLDKEEAKRAARLELTKERPAAEIGDRKIPALSDEAKNKIEAAAIDQENISVEKLGLEMRPQVTLRGRTKKSQTEIDIDDISLNRDDLKRDRLLRMESDLAQGVKRQRAFNIEVTPDPKNPGKYIIGGDGNHRVAYLKLAGQKGKIAVTLVEEIRKAAGAVKRFIREEEGSFPASPGPKRTGQTAQLRAITAKTVGKPRTGLAAITAATVRQQQPAAGAPLPRPSTAPGATKSRFAKGFEVLGDLYHGPKSLLSSFDLSAAGRQGFFLSAPPSQLPVAAKAFGRQVKSLVSTKSYDQFVDRLRNNADYQAGKDAGLFLATEDPSASFSARDESFVSKLIGKLPHVKYSEQAYKTYLDSLRMDTFAKYRKAIERQPGTAEQKQTALKAAAEWINTSTGRGKLHGKSGEIVESATPLLNTIFFAPRFTISRFQMLNPATYGRNLRNPQSRIVFKKQMSELFQSAGVLVATGALAKAAGADISLDPEEADFLKLKFKNTRYDVLAGLQQTARLTARIGDWIRQEFTEEDQKKLAGSRGDIAETLKRFGRTKLAPVPSFFVDWLNDWKNVIGERTTPSEFSVKNPIAQRVLPLMFSDMVEAYMRGYREGGAEQGVKTAARFAPAVLGAGVQDYERKPGRVGLESASGLSGELRRHGQSFESVRAKDGESERAHRRRAERIEGWFEQYGEKLINSGEYKSANPEQQERAIKTLRRRLGDRAADQSPRMSDLDPGRIFRSIRMGERRRIR